MATWMQIPELSIEWYQKNENSSRKIFQFEKKIFGDKYSSCPSTYRDFLKFFNYAYLQVTLSLDTEIVGLLIADELIKDTLYYLRLIGVKHDLRNMGLGTNLFLNFVKSIQNNSYISFVSNNKILHHIAYCSDSLQATEIIPDNIQQKLTSYNKRLCGVKPMQIIERYYHLQTSDYSDASFLFFLKGNSNESR